MILGKTKLLRLWASLLVVSLLLGCGGKSANRRQTSKNASKTSTGQEHLDRALRYLNQADEYDRGRDFYSRLTETTGQSKVREQVLFHLSFWLSQQPKAKAWGPDSLIQRLPERFRPLKVLQELDILRFNPGDMAFLEETKWFRDVARRVEAAPPSPALLSWQSESGLQEEDFDQLLLAERLFDWSIRNVQLDPLPPEPKLDPNFKLPFDQNLATAMSPALQGLPGPGYTQRPWEVLLFGHGDAWMRGRVFIYLCRQVGIDAVLLAVRRGEQEIPWAVGVLLNERAYIFDPALGLPLPSAAGKGVCHVQELVENPKLLEQLKVPGMDYVVTPADLKNIGALMDAAPDYLTEKAYILQQNLTGKNQMVLSYSPSTTVRTLNSTKGIRWNRIWPVPFDCLVYVTGRHYRSRANPDLAMRRLENAVTLLQYNPLSQGRQLHFRGQFENAARETGQTDKPGALSLYMETRWTDDKIGKIVSSQAVQREIGLVRQEAEIDQSWRARLERTQRVAQDGKNFASYWIGLIHYEKQSFESAIEWFHDRTLKAKAETPWRAGARYNLARCYEQLQQGEKARRLYEEDQSPQRHGNLLRARWLAAGQPKSSAKQVPGGQEKKPATAKSPAEAATAKKAKESTAKKAKESTAKEANKSAGKASTPNESPAQRPASTAERGNQKTAKSSRPSTAKAARK